MIRCLMTSQNHLLSPLLYLHILYYHIQARASWPHPCMMPLESRISCWSYHMDLGQRTDCTESAYPSLQALQCTPFAWHIFLASWKKKMCMVLLNWIYLVNIFNWIETIWSFYQFCSRPGLGKMLPWMKFVKIFHHELNLHYFCELAWIMLLAVNEMFEKSPSELTYLLTSLDKYVIRKTCYCVCLKYLCAS